MFDLNKMMKQAQQMQQQMGDIQAELQATEIQGTAGGGAVTIVSNGKYEFKQIRFSADAPLGDAGMLEDLVLAALQDLNQKITRMAEEKMQAVTAGLNIPGLKLPGF